MNVKSQFFPNRVSWRLDLAIGLSRKFKPRANGLASLTFVLQCNSWRDASASGMLGMCASFWRLAVASHLQDPAASPFFLHNLEQFFSLSHTLPLHDSHLNTSLLIAKTQANLARNKANKMVDKIQPYTPLSRTLLFFSNVRFVTSVCPLAYGCLGGEMILDS